MLVGASGRVIAGHRYLIVTAIQQSYQRDGYGTAILEALFEQLRETGVDSVEWLVHPANHRSRDELERWVEHLDGCGALHSGISDMPYGSVIVLRDPDNIQLELFALATDFRVDLDDLVASGHSCR